MPHLWLLNNCQSDELHLRGVYTLTSGGKYVCKHRTQREVTGKHETVTFEVCLRLCDDGLARGVEMCWRRLWMLLAHMTSFTNSAHVVLRCTMLPALQLTFLLTRFGVQEALLLYSWCMTDPDHESVQILSVDLYVMDLHVLSFLQVCRPASRRSWRPALTPPEDLMA